MEAKANEFLGNLSVLMTMPPYLSSEASRTIAFLVDAHGYAKIFPLILLFNGFMGITASVSSVEVLAIEQEAFSRYPVK